MARRQRVDVLVARRLILLALVAAPAVAQDAAPDERLWSEIAALRQTPASRPDADRFALARRQREALLAALRKYELLYPGGPRADEAIQIELETLFEIAALNGGRTAELCERVVSILAAPPSPLAESEAAYWNLLCRRMERRTTATSPATTSSPIEDLHPPPASQPIDRLAPDELRGMREFLQHFPRSRFAPRVAEQLVAEDLRRGDLADAETLLLELRAAHPEDVRVERLAGRIARRTQLSQPFEFTGNDLNGKPVDARTEHGNTLVLIAWSPLRRASTKILAEVQAWRSGGSGHAAIGLVLEGSRDAAVAAVARAGVEWPQVLDPLGAAGEFCRRWGVGAAPTIFVIDRDGRLRGVFENHDWRACAEQLERD